jgi:hypothetical protein
MTNDFGSNPAQASGKRSKQTESYGIATIELPNGQRLDGYVLLSEKNAAKLGITSEQLAALVAGKKKGSVAVTLHLQFGDKDLAVAAPVEIAFG